MLAVVWAIKKCRIYLLGKVFVIQTDHKPLTSILDKQGLNDIANPRLQRMREKILVYKFTTEWIKGKENSLADALSRHPTEREEENDEPHLISRVEIRHKDVVLSEIQEKARGDAEYQKLIEGILNGFF